MNICTNKPEGHITFTRHTKMLKKDTLEGIIQDTRHLLAFHQSLGIDAYPLTEGLEKFIEAPGQKKKKPRPRRIPAPLPPETDRKSSTPAAAPSTPIKTLADIRKQLGDCSRCALHKNRSSILFGSGAEGAKLMIIGEWPNIDDDRDGELFSGQDGEMLDKMLKHVLKIEREDVYITSIIKCLASEKDPNHDQMQTCLPFLLGQIRTINPTVIWTMGPAAAQILLQTNKPLIRLRGHFHKFRDILLMPTFHPSYLAKNPEMKQAVFIDLKLIAQKLAVS